MMAISVLASTLLILLFTPLFVFASVDPPGSITLIRPNPNINVPQYANLTYGFTSSNTQYWGLIQNIRMWYMMPDGTQNESSTYGPAITSGGTFQDSGYSPDECRSFPGTTTLNVVNVTETGMYTFFWNVTYVESSNSGQANSTYCGPPPFSQQNWLLNSTVKVAEADLGTAIVGAIGTTTRGLPSKPTGRVNTGAAVGIWGEVNTLIWASAAGLALGIGLMV